MTCLSLLILLTGCASSEPKYVWTKGRKPFKEVDYTIDDSICEADSYKAIPIQNSTTNCADMSGFAAGMCAGSQARQNQRIYELRGRIYDGCMLGKGWSKEFIKK